MKNYNAQNLLDFKLNRHSIIPYGLSIVGFSFLLLSILVLIAFQFLEFVTLFFVVSVIINIYCYLSLAKFKKNNAEITKVQLKKYEVSKIVNTIALAIQILVVLFL